MSPKGSQTHAEIRAVSSRFAVIFLSVVTFALAIEPASAEAPPLKSPREAQAQPCLKASRGEVEARLKKVVAEHLGIDKSKVTDNAKFIDDLHADNLDSVELVMAFEEEFGLEIPDEAAEKMVTVKNAVDFVLDHQCEQNP